MSKPIDQELLPCPFCGDPNPNLTHDDYIHEDGQPMAVVECAKCHTWVQAEAWNKRASVQPAGVAVPEGWRIESQGNRIVVQHMQSGAGYAAERKGESGIAESVLYLLANTMLAAGPQPVSGEQVQCNCPGGSKPNQSAHAPNCPARKPTAQGVAGLVEMLDSMVCAYRSAIVTGYDRITGLGGQCDAVDYMLASFPDYAKAKAVVAAHRAQQGEQKP